MMLDFKGFRILLNPDPRRMRMTVPGNGKRRMAARIRRERGGMLMNGESFQEELK